jgi:hypothetical protein
MGPCAVEIDQARAALAWAVKAMKDKYRSGNGHGHKRLILVVDEFQQLVQDSAIVNMLSTIAAQGRGAGVHLLAATQHPTVEAFGTPATRRNLTGKLALRVTDPDASRVAVGGNTPRADHLLGAGDSYVVGPGKCHRVQQAYTDQADIDQALEQGNGRTGWEFEQWPGYDPVDLGMGLGLPDDGDGYARHAGNTSEPWSVAEVATALIAALEGEGRDAMAGRAEGMFDTHIGSTRGRRLVKFGREIHDAMIEQGYTFATAM